MCVCVHVRTMNKNRGHEFEREQAVTYEIKGREKLYNCIIIPKRKK